MQASDSAASPRSIHGIVVGASAASSRVLSSSRGVDERNGKSRNASTRQNASAIIRSTRLSGAAGVSRA
jgi:hypothetical protein